MKPGMYSTIQDLMFQVLLLIHLRFQIQYSISVTKINQRVKILKDQDLSNNHLESLEGIKYVTRTLHLPRSTRVGHSDMDIGINRNIVVPWYNDNLKFFSGCK